MPKIMQQLGRRVANETDKRRAIEFLLQRLSVALQRGNVAAVPGIYLFKTS